MTVLALMNEATSMLEAAGIEEAQLNAQWLLSAVMNVPRLELLSFPKTEASPEKEKEFRKKLELKMQGVPLAYITGEQNFRGMSLSVGKSVLVPRPETEELVGLALEKIRSAGREVSVLDFGTGSGAIALAIAREAPMTAVTGADISVRALACARKNAKSLGLDGRVSFKKAGSLSELGKKFDFIVTNPPYIPTSAIQGLSVEVRYEPKTALDGGSDGFRVIRTLAAQASVFLTPGGSIFMEMGLGQGAGVLGFFDSGAWSELRVIRDLSGKERFIYGRTHG